jgi:TldD protein
MKVEFSRFLTNNKPLIKKLIDILMESCAYVSVLGTDTGGKSYLVSKTTTDIGDYRFAERGFVIRIHNGTNYSEYSFNDINEDNINSIAEAVKVKLGKVSEGISVNQYEVIEEEAIKQSFIGEVQINPDEVSTETIINDLTGIRDKALAYSGLIANFRASYTTIHISKMFMSAKKDLEQTYIVGESRLFSLARKENDSNFYFATCTGRKGYEVVNEIREMWKDVVDHSIELLESEHVKPGKYDVICAPDVTGLIAHEAFGHGVEMDMFVKQRAKGAFYMNKQVASPLINMHDGAKAADQISSYFFDDEGTIGTDTLVIKEGILKSGISDLLSALKLGTTPTGNGKRESFERKAYSRMTNTFFEGGKDKVEDMIASIKHGYLLQGMYSGMEDPKDWGIQCILLSGREIVDGRFTGKMISPVFMTGFVPDLLKSISMVSEKVELEGAGFCGKGYKEFVKTSNGGPYIKARGRLG